MSFINLFKQYFSRNQNNTSVKNQEAAPESLSTMTVVELKAEAKERGLSGYSKLKKSDLVKLLS